MAVGPSKSASADMLDAIGAGLWAQMHADDPGEDGTANIAFVQDRAQVVLDPAVDNVRVLNAQADWPVAWAGGEQEVSHVSLWTADTGGDFRASLRLVDPVKFTDGKTPRLTLLSIIIPGVAAN